MAVRPQNMHDGGILERRLRPIYDWLDNGNNKKALQEAEKVLKKCPTLQAARALKALALLRLGKGAEAHIVLDALAEEKPSDDTTLQAMTISYRESQQLHKVCAIYEAAVKVEPTSEELHSHLFMSYVRVGDYRSQQRAAMALYKFAPKNPYYFWAVMSIVLQAKTSEDNTKRGILLSLAQRMIDNFITENKMEAEQEARLYIMILELQEKWEEVLKFIEGPLYSQLVPGSTAQACIPYLTKLGLWRRLNLICKELLWENIDRWDYYLPYFDSVFHLIKESEEDPESTVDNTAEKCHEFICQLVESMSSGRTVRGPYLARLELWKRLAVDGDPTSLLGSGLALCVQYLRVFAHKPCAVADLRPYLSMIPQKEREEKCRDFLTCLGFDENSEPESVGASLEYLRLAGSRGFTRIVRSVMLLLYKWLARPQKNADDIQRHVACLAAWRLTAEPLPAEGALSLAARLRDQYMRCYKGGLLTSTITEFCPADSYGILAAHHYFYAAVQQQSSAPVVEALCLLELVLHNSTANFHAKLLLIKLYHVLGNALAADSIYQRLEVKHIQLISLGWLHCARLAPSCVTNRALQLLADTRAFHTHHGKDSVEHVTYAYKYGTFEKLVELGAWGARLESCAWAAAAHKLARTLQLVGGPAAPAHRALTARLPDRPTDNRDLNVIVNYEPPQFQDNQLKARTFDQEVSYLRLKDALVSSVDLCVELADTRAMDKKREYYEQLVSCLDAFSVAMDKCKQMYSERERICIATPFPSRIIAFVNSPVPYRELYCKSLRLVGELAMGRVTSAYELSSSLTILMPTAQEQLASEVKVIGDGGWCMRDCLEYLSNYLEFIGIITSLLGVCYELITPTKTKKSKKKITQSPDELKTSELLNKLNDTVQSSICFLEDILDAWPNYDFVSIEQSLSDLTLEDKYQSIVKTKLINGRDDMLYDVRNILKIKSKFLKYVSIKI